MKGVVGGENPEAPSGLAGAAFAAGHTLIGLVLAWLWDHVPPLHEQLLRSDRHAAPPPRADAPYAVVLAGADGASVLRMDQLTEAEAEWLAAEVRRVATNAGGRAAAPR